MVYDVPRAKHVCQQQRASSLYYSCNKVRGKEQELDVGAQRPSCCSPSPTPAPVLHQKPAGRRAAGLLGSRALQSGGGECRQG